MPALDSLAADVLARDGEIAIRRMRDVADDYALIVTWRNRPHVREWWEPDEPPMTMAQCVTEQLETVDGTTPTTSCIIVFGGADVGFVQFYPWAAYADEVDELGLDLPEGTWGLDIFIGEDHLVDRGIGSRTVALVGSFLAATMGARSLALGVEATNVRARSAYEKAGMRCAGEFLDTDTRNGERVRSLLMIRNLVDGT